MKTNTVEIVLIALYIVSFLGICIIADKNIRKVKDQEIVINSLTGDVQVLKDSIDCLHDDINIRDMEIISLQNKYKTLSDSVSIYKEDAFVYKYKIERIKAYDNIVRKNSSQSKYFLGWVRRVIEE